MLRITIASLLIAIPTALPSAAQARQDAPLPTVDSAFRASTIDNLAAVLDAQYVSRDTAAEAIKAIREKNAAGEYDKLTSPLDFAAALSKDLQVLAEDRHLRLRFDPGAAPSEADDAGPSAEDLARFTEMLRKRNYGFEKVEILEGNVGYLKLNGFMDLNEDAYRAATSAMNFLANADAVIVDLRTNGGGSPSMVQFLCSYFFSADEPVHLNSLYYREGDTLNQFWTLPYVPGKRLPEVPLYVLTSPRTFSGAEEFSFNLQTRDRAEIVGQTTGGGANPGGTRRIDANFTAFIPMGRAVNPVTNTNWETVGVKPDVECDTEAALATAHALALDALRAKAADPDAAAALAWAAASVHAAANPVTLDAAALSKFTGAFGERRTWMEGDALMYQRADTPAHQLTPLSPTLFAIDGTTQARIRFVPGPDGAAAQLVVLYEDGRETPADRTN